MRAAVFTDQLVFGRGCWRDFVLSPHVESDCLLNVDLHVSMYGGAFRDIVHSAFNALDPFTIPVLSHSYIVGIVKQAD